MKNTFKSLIILWIIILWLPSSPLDFISIPLIISKIGATAYIMISILMVLYLYKTIEGKDLSAKLKTIHSEVKSLFK